MRSIFMLAVLVAGSGWMVAQTAPVKMGLWEKKIVTSNGMGAPDTTIAKSSITPETLQQMVGNAMKQHEGCTINNAKSGQAYTFNATCTMPHGLSMVMSGTSTIQDSEHIVSESRSTITANGKAREIQFHSTSTFLSPNCGVVKPGEPVIEDK